VIRNPKKPEKPPGESNIVKLFVDDCTKKISNACQELPCAAYEKASVTRCATRAKNASTLPHSDHERKAMAVIEKKLYCYPAVAAVTAFRYQIRHGNTKFGAAILLYDWIEAVTTTDIEKWIAKHFPDKLPIKIVWLDTDFSKA